MARSFLNELKWHPDRSLEGVAVIYLHRGAPRDRMSVEAEDIIRFERSFFVIERDDHETYIPFHRILEITQDGQTIWKKKK